MDIAKTKNIIRDNLLGLSIDLAIIGSQSHKDLDVFIVNNQKQGLSNFDDTLSFLDRLNQLVKELDCEIIVKHEHRSWVNENKRLIHLLFYPSYDHLEVWELPSFIACTYSNGNFLIGNNERLGELYIKYRKRDFSPAFDIETYHLLVYMDLAVTNLIYLTLDSNIFSKSVFFENLQYVFRYTLRELFVSKLSNSDSIYFWEKHELIEYIESEFQEFIPVARLLRHDINSNSIKYISLKQIKSLFLEYLKLCDSRLEISDDLLITEILDSRVSG